MKVYTIGRSAECSIVIDDPMVSRRHALLKIYSFGKMELISLGQNGTFVNNVKLKNNTSFPISRKDVVNITKNQVLDWNLIPNPLKNIKIGVACFCCVIVIISAICIGNNFLKQTNDFYAPYEDEYRNPQRTESLPKVSVTEKDTVYKPKVDGERELVSFEDILETPSKNNRTTTSKPKVETEESKKENINKSTKKTKDNSAQDEKDVDFPFVMFN